MWFINDGILLLTFAQKESQLHGHGTNPSHLCSDSPGLLCLIRFHLIMLQIAKVPVQTCLQKRDCQSCVRMEDPYCGWCVLEGR